jgi:hypothetical protein
LNAPALAAPDALPAGAEDAAVDVDELAPAAGADADVCGELVDFDELHAATNVSAARTANAAGRPCRLR